MFLLWGRERHMLRSLQVTGGITFLSVCLYCYLWRMSGGEGYWPKEFSFIKTYADARVKKIALWTTWFGEKKWGHYPEKRTILNCGVNVTCQLYNTKTHPLRYDALLFHGWDPQRPPSERSPRQAYIMFLHESPAYKYIYEPGNTFYNWTMTYSRTSDFLLRYFTIRKRMLKIGNDGINAYHSNGSAVGTSGKHNIKVTLSGHGGIYNLSDFEATMHHARHEVKASVFWVVSHCNTSGRREIYVNALKQHLAVDIYGKCAQDCKVFEKYSGLRCHDFLARTGQYKFYLSFENSACRDYITEKVYHPLRHGIVPIVYGGLSTEEYTAMLPPGSFIDVRNFTSPKHLAEYLLYLDKNDKAYLAYHAWREEWEIVAGDDKGWCDMCNALHNVGNVPPRNVDWAKFWNPATECDDHLLEKVLGKDDRQLV